MYSTTDRIPKFVTATIVLALAAGLSAAPLALAAPAKDAAGDTEITGEIVDMMCYVDHNATGEKHEACAEKCIKSGGPVGVLSDGKAYLVIGSHKPINDELAPLAAKTVTLKGKLVSNGGVSMLENAEIVKK
ncbi:MAG: hypothetical protein ACREIF_17100 [Chthoniobacterales bacterium]